MDKITKDYELTIVDDNSSDNSAEICKQLSRKNNRIRCLSYHNGPSRRENLARSFKDARGDIIAFMDADLSVDLVYLKRLFDEIEKGADISMGSRYAKGSYIKRTFLRKFVSYFYNLAIRLYFNSYVLDHQCGFKAFKKDVILELVNDMGYDKKFIRGWLWDAEMLIRAQRKSYKIMEFPIKWKHGQKSEFNFKRELKLIPYMIRLKKVI